VNGKKFSPGEGREPRAICGGKEGEDRHQLQMARDQWERPRRWRHQAELAQPASEEVRVTYRPHMTERQGRRGLPVSPREREGARARMWLLGWLGRFKQWVVQGKKFYFSKLFSFLNPVLFLNSFLGEMNTYLNI
jgi:hypothetical protein